MDPVTVKLALALICFQGQCYPALVGKDTPIGTYNIQTRQVLESGYGGDVLQFREDATYVWAIHRVWTGRPAERRVQRLTNGTAEDRLITHGCINIMPDVYDKLKACCSNSSLEVQQ